MKLFDIFKRDKRTLKRRLGDRGEDVAVSHLEKEGYLIRERNWVHKKQEIDIIAEKEGLIAFVEVKTTASEKAESVKRPSDAVDLDKRKNLTDCAREYMLYIKRRYPKYSYEMRFDVIEVYLNRDEPEINHIKDAFFAEKGYRKWKT